MRIKRLVLKNFRNYSDLSWQPQPFLNILSGNNAQGKTNLLEAIFFCTTGRSFRTTREREMTGWPAKSCFAGVELEKINSTVEIKASLDEGGRTSFQLNGSRLSRAGIFRSGLAVSFTPADLDLVRGSPSERRKWLDLELGPFDNRYAYNLGHYEKVLAQRNNLLRTPGGRDKLPELAAPWDEQMFIYGSSIIESRLRLLKAIFPHLREVYSALTSGKEELSFNYLSSLPLEKGAGPEDLRRIYQETVRKKFGLEVARRQSLFGPHRDDLLFLINGAEARKFASRGQQRSLVLSLKLSLMKLFQQDNSEYPVLLLDDVFQELDRQRRQELERLLEGEAQVFVTSDRRLEGAFFGKAGNYTVCGGKIIKEGEV